MRFFVQTKVSKKILKNAFIYKENYNMKEKISYVQKFSKRICKKLHL